MFKAAFGIALIMMLLLSLFKWLIPQLSLSVVVSPLLILSAIVIIIWVIEILFEVFKVILNLAAIAIIIYLFLKIL
jgi:hypothetical protein